MSDRPIHSQAELIKILERASTLKERLGGEFISDREQIKEDQINCYLEEWCQVVGAGDLERFEKRLSWDGLNLERVLPILTAVRLKDDQNLPHWLETLTNGLKAATLFDLNQPSDYPQLPFVEVFLPLINLARTKVIAKTGSSYELMTKTAHQNLEFSLLEFLVHLGSRSLQLEFAVFCGGIQTNNSLSDLASESNKAQYLKFVKGLLEGGLLLFFQEYSVLGRLIATTVDLWVDTTAEFMVRLATDWTEIQQTFQPKKELGKVIAIAPNLSERHHQGRTALELTFAAGLKLIYKPKNLGLDIAYINLLNWFNQEKLPLKFKLIKILNRDDYGWVEFIENLPCLNQEAAQRYYQRAGMLLSLMYLLDARECNCENIIANGEYPVLREPETLMHPRFQEDELPNEDRGVQVLANYQLGNSVIRTGFLPRWKINSREQYYDDSGLWGMGEGRTAKANLPKLGNTYLSPTDYLEEIVNGFQVMYLFLIKKRDKLITSNSPLAEIAQQSVRFLFRTTKVYNFILNKILQPKFIRTGIDWSIQLDILDKALLDSQTVHPCWSLAKAEKKSLELMDIPIFTVKGNSRDLIIAPGEKIENFFNQSSEQNVIDKFHQLHERDLNKQIEIIRNSIYILIAHQTQPKINNSSHHHSGKKSGILTAKQLIAEAVIIGEDLKKRAIISTQKGMIWMGLNQLAKAEYFQLNPLGYDLDNGIAGIALFFAALAKVSDQKWGEFALATLQPLRQNLQSHNLDGNIFQNMGIGGAKGLGAIIYVLVRVSEFLSAPDMIKDAKKVAALITKDKITSDRYLDIFSGSAGAILGLLALYEIERDQKVLETAIACAHNILFHLFKSNSSFSRGKFLNSKLPISFYQGYTGIAYALLRLYKITNHVNFLEAASEIIIDCNNSRQNLHHICDYYLGDLAQILTDNKKEIKQKFKTGLKPNGELKLQGVDNLYEGNFGMIEIALLTSQKLNLHEGLEIANKQASWVINRAKHTGGFKLFTNLPTDAYTPSFFSGSAGIGYELLRLAAPELFPSVILWE